MVQGFKKAVERVRGGSPHEGGSGRVQTIRHTARQTKLEQQRSILIGVERLSRQQALFKIKTYLKRSPNHQSARQLISLFNIHPEELTEIGISYEILKVLEAKY
jgi:hypothetical protein